MPAPKTLEDKLAALAALGAASPGSVAPATLDALRAALRDKNSFVVAKAAEIASRLELAGLAPDLSAAFHRLLPQAAKADKGCRAKAALADALYRLNLPADDVFLAGVRHFQPEPVWGGQEDTAAALRSACALGLVRMNHPAALATLADLLADPEIPARAAAAAAIAYSENPAGVPLLRLRARVGDEPAVLAECFTALLKLDPAGSVPFVASFLAHADLARAQTAAMALGQSRREDALAALQLSFESTLDPERRRASLLAIALLRLEPAMAFLIDQVATGTTSAARDALDSLATYRHDPALARRTLDAAAARDEPDFLRRAAEAFKVPA